MGAQCELKAGDRVRIESGGEAVVRKELGRGGQGIVYLVEYNRKEYALKWYFYDKLSHPEEFRRNLAQNIADGAPVDYRYHCENYQVAIVLKDQHVYAIFKAEPNVRVNSTASILVFGFNPDGTYIGSKLLHK